MSASGLLLLLLVGPGTLFFVMAGKHHEMKSPSGWLQAMLLGLFFSFLTAFGFAAFGKAEAVWDVLGGGKIVANVADFSIVNYILAFTTGSFWRIFRLSKSPAEAWLSVEKRFRGEGEFFVSRNILEHLLFVCYSVKVKPVLRVVTTVGEYEGECIKYQWSDPPSLLILEGKDSRSMMVYVRLSEVKAVYLKNWAVIKKARYHDEGKYLRYIDESLPEKLKGKRDGCGNLWWPEI